MKINEPGLYHIYNRGNNKQKLIFSERNYHYFLGKCHEYIKPCAAILAWCLMPNHFHFLLDITEQGLQPVKTGAIIIPAITNGFRLLQSSYAKGVNIEQHRTGNLFQQKTKSKFLSGEENYGITVFHYIHQNPVASRLVKYPEDWPYSSFRDFCGYRYGSLCNIEKAKELLQLNSLDIQAETMKEIDEVVTRMIL